MEVPNEETRKHLVWREGPWEQTKAQAGPRCYGWDMTECFPKGSCAGIRVLTVTVLTGGGAFKRRSLVGGS